MTRQTLFDKIWAQHAIAELAGGVTLLHIDRHLLHDLEGGPCLARIAAQGRPVHNPELTFASPDHAIASAPDRTTDSNPAGGRLLRQLRQHTFAAGIR